MYFKINNKNILFKKNLVSTLHKIIGINSTLFSLIWQSTLMHRNTDLNVLNNEYTKILDLKQFFLLFEDFFEITLLKKETDQITFLKEIKHYNGFKHIYGYPVRGQRNRTNASTALKRRKVLKK